jgi:hypothetical protein
VAPKVIERAFNLEEPLRDPVGVYLNQPNPYAQRGRQLYWAVPLLVAALAVIQTVSAKRAARQDVLSTSFHYRAGETNAVVVTEPFELAGGRQALEYDLSAPVDNNWIELDINLVNAETHKVAAVCDRDIEYYHGYDDGPWSEGTQTRKELVPAVAPGKYYLAIEATADHAVKEMPYSVTVVRDAMVWSNFWIAAALVLVYPLYCWARAGTFEHARWLESDFSPFSSRTSDD